MDFPFIVTPGDPKNNLSLWFTNTLNDFFFSEFRKFHQHRPQRLQHIMYRLVKLCFPRISVNDILENRPQFFIKSSYHHNCLVEKNEKLALKVLMRNEMRIY